MDSESHRLVHSLTAHLALYHSHIPNPNTNTTPRTSTLRWFSSLTPAHRQAVLTVSDSSFIHILLQMQSLLRRHGQSHFILLADLPSSSDPSLPSLSFRPSRGLMSRSAESNASASLISASVLLFSTSSDVALADAMTLSDSLVADIDRFVGAMDGISGGRFLCEEVEMPGLIVQWLELPWLKNMGYYSLEAFVVNRLEVALRLAWISSQGGKKPKEKRMKERAAEVAGRAANSFWRMKGCFDWWVGLDPGIRKAIISAFFGKSSKHLVNNLIKEDNVFLNDGLFFLSTGKNMKLQCGQFLSWKKSKQSIFRSEADLGFDILPAATSKVPSNLAIILNKLVVFCAISNSYSEWQSGEFESEKMLFGSLCSNLVISDHIRMAFQRFLMVFYNNFLNRELMNDSKQSILSGNAGEKGILVCRKGEDKPHSSKNFSHTHKALNATTKSRKTSKKLDCRSELNYHESSSVAARSNINAAVSFVMNNASGSKSSSKQEDMKNLNSRISFDSKENIGKRKSRKGPKNRSSDAKNFGKPKHEGTKVTNLSELTKATEFECNSNSQPNALDKTSFSDISLICSTVDALPTIKDIQENQFISSTTIKKCHPCFKQRGNDLFTQCSSFFNESQEHAETPLMCLKDCELDSVATDGKHVHEIYNVAGGSSHLKSFVSKECILTAVNEKGSAINRGNREFHAYRDKNFMGGTSHEWPSITPISYPSINSHFLPATNRLHLDVGVKFPYHNYQSFTPSKPHVGNSLNEFGHNWILPLTFPMSYDCPPMVKNCPRMSRSQTVGYESAYSQSMPPSLYSSLVTCIPHGVLANKTSGDNEVKHDMKNISDFIEDEGYWFSEEETEVYARSGRDYSKFFGGGVMYWNPTELVGTGYSRPPSYSSEDSSWAWHDADLNRTIDDMVGCKSGLPIYSTNGITSPSASTFCPPFDSLVSGHPSAGYSFAGNDDSSTVIRTMSDLSDEKILCSSTNSTGGIEGTKEDPIPYPILRPIIIPGMTRKGSRSDFKLAHDNKSGCLPLTRRDAMRIKRPPSPVVLCVPRMPQPPPRSPVEESRKRGFPIVRSGSSSPRNWGVKTRCHEENMSVDTRFYLGGTEVVWPMWANKGLGATAVAPSLQGSLLQEHLIAISQLAHDQEHPDVALPLQSPNLLNALCKGPMLIMQNLLHEEIDFFCKQVAAENLMRKPFINWAIRRVTRSLQVLWPRSRTNLFGSNATGLALPISDVDLVVSLPPVRNLEPIKEAGILEGRNGIKETCLQHAARYLANQEWVRNDSLKTIENTAVPLIMLVAEVPCDITLSHGSSSIVEISRKNFFKPYEEHNSASHLNISVPENELSSKSSTITEDKLAVGVKSIRIDISFKSASHSGIQTSELVRELTKQFPASVPLALVLKKFLEDRSLDHSYSGGLSSYCLVLLITRFLQHEHHCGYNMKQNLGRLLMDFLYFFGNVFDPRQMRISIQGSGVYIKRERGLSIDPIHIDDPLFLTNNVGRNCFRIHQCIKAFADAYTTLESELSQISDECIPSSAPSFRLLRKIIPSIDNER